MNKFNKEDSSTQTDKERAKMAGVDTGTVARYDAVMNSNDKDLKQRVLSGKTAINTGYKKTKEKDCICCNYIINLK